MRNTKDKVLAPFCMALSILAIVATVNAHEGEVHPKKPELQKVSPTEKEDQLYKQINAEYVKDVKPILQKSCFDCHSSNTNYPWYAKLPGAKQLIEKDIRESKEHLDLTNDFPFKGHGTPVEDLKAISEAVVNESMPPFRYWILHPSAKLNDQEKQTVRAWVEASLNDLNGKSSEHTGHSGH